MQEPRVGVDLCVDADPELHVALQLRRARHGVVLRQGRREHEPAQGRENPPPGERPSDRAARAPGAPCRVHLHSCKREILMRVQGLVAHPPPSARLRAPLNASGILTLPGVVRRFGVSRRAPPLDDQARAVLTTSTASQLREPRATTCRTAAASGSVGMSVANPHNSNGNPCRDGSKTTGFTNKKAQIRNAAWKARRILCLGPDNNNEHRLLHTQASDRPRESGVFFGWATGVSVIGRTKKPRQPAGCLVRSRGSVS